mmetsp:Transcript_112632/g.318157  ORF Transcript_112632/g.318157 Transcript_112632/m.318157 type:complete len:268 (+) Transcript_112632:3563-4366(+)
MSQAARHPRSRRMGRFACDPYVGLLYRLCVLRPALARPSPRATGAPAGPGRAQWPRATRIEAAARRTVPAALRAAFAVPPGAAWPIASRPCPGVPPRPGTSRQQAPPAAPQCAAPSTPAVDAPPASLQQCASPAPWYPGVPSRRQPLQPPPGRRSPGAVRRSVSPSLLAAFATRPGARRSWTSPARTGPCDLPLLWPSQPKAPPAGLRSAAPSHPGAPEALHCAQRPCVSPARSFPLAIELRVYRKLLVALRAPRACPKAPVTRPLR